MIRITQNLKNNIKESLKISIMALVITLGVTYSYAAWVGPTSTPPNNNIDAPINVGETSQIKDGGLGVDTLAVFGNSSVSGYFKLGTTSDECNSGIEGAQRYVSGSGIQYCNGEEWVGLMSTSACMSSGSQSYTTPGIHTLDITDETSECNFEVVVKGAGGGLASGLIGSPAGAVGGATQFDFVPGSAGTFSFLVGGTGTTGSTGGGYGGGGSGGTNAGQGWYCSGGGGASAVSFESVVLSIAGGGGGIAAHLTGAHTGVGGSENNSGGSASGIGGDNNIGGAGSGASGNVGTSGAGGSNGGNGVSGSVGNGGVPGQGGIGFPQFFVSGGGGGASSGTSGCGGGGGGAGYGGGGGGEYAAGGGGYVNLSETSNALSVSGVSGGQNGSITISW